MKTLTIAIVAAALLASALQGCAARTVSLFAHGSPDCEKSACMEAPLSQLPCAAHCLTRRPERDDAAPIAAGTIIAPALLLFAANIIRRSGRPPRRFSEFIAAFLRKRNFATVILRN